MNKLKMKIFARENKLSSIAGYNITLQVKNVYWSYKGIIKDKL